MPDRRTTLTIANGASESQDLSFLESKSQYPAVVLIIAPSTLPETVNIQCRGATNNGLLQSPPATDIAIAAGKAIELLLFAGRTFRLKATGNVAADRVFDVEWHRYYPR